MLDHFHKNVFHHLHSDYNLDFTTTRDKNLVFTDEANHRTHQEYTNFKSFIKINL